MEDVNEVFSTRTEMLIGKSAINKLTSSKVIIFGIGGVGGYVTEALARASVGNFLLVDHDTVSLSNCNRQIIATRDTIGRQKTEVMRERILSINPAAHVECRDTFFLPENEEDFDFSKYDYVIDAVDTVTAKIALVEKAKRENVPIICSMGAGNKLNPAGFQVADIYETSVCPLARVMRRELKKRGINDLKVVYSKEPPILPRENVDGERSCPGSISFVPSAAGLVVAGAVVMDLISF